MDPQSSSIRNSRPRLLYSFGASFLTISHKAFRRMEQFDNPLGFVSRAFAFIATPIVNSLELQWLWILSFFDDRILDIEDIAMFIFPQSEQLFFALDDLAIFVESLPKRLEDTINSLPSLLREVPMFEPVLKTLLTLTGTTQDWGPKKDIVVDAKCNEKKGTVTTEMEKEDEDDDVKADYAYKENLEKLEKNEIVEEMETKIVEEIETKVENRVEGKSEEEEEEAAESMDLAILELLDEGWGMGLRARNGRK